MGVEQGDNKEVEMESGNNWQIPSDVENPEIPLLMHSLAPLRNKLNQLCPLSANHCIYRVPKQLHIKNPAAYIPKVVSIGPIHHGREGLEAMEEYKERFLQCFLERVQLSLEDYAKFIKDRELRLRECYSDSVEPSTSNEFVLIMMVDSAFLLEVLLKNFEEMDERCRIFNRPFLISNIMEDVMLLENQLPLFILEDLYNLAKDKAALPTIREGDNDREFSFMELVCLFVNEREDIGTKEYDLDKVCSTKVEHLLDCLRSCHLSLSSPKPNPPSDTLPINTLGIPNIRALHQSGVQFTKNTSSNHLLHVEFERGTLKLPGFFLGDSTETIYRNLLAYELCHYIDDSRLIDYFCLMDQLINDSRDIELLVKSKILENTLGDNDEAARIFNSLAQGLLISSDFCFANICKDLIAHYERPWNNWKASLKQDYFNSPWASISVIAAIILLVLTVLQTVYTVSS